MVGKTVFAVAAGASVAAATCSAPTTQLGGNAVFSPSGSVTPTIGSPFTVQYDGTGLSNSLTFYLLMGPSTNIANIGTIAAGVANCGTSSCSFTWTPDCSLAATTTNAGYGIQMVDDATCMYQYTTQFGLNSGSSCTKPSSSAAPPPSSSAAPPPPSSSAKSPPPSSSAPAPVSSSKAPTSSAPVVSSKGNSVPSSKASSVPAASGSPTWSSSWKASPTGGSGSGSGPYTAPAAGNGTSNGTSYTPPGVSGGASPSYKPLQSNDGARFAVSGLGAIIALAASVMLL